jgi:hypothetical protein
LPGNARNMARMDQGTRDAVGIRRQRRRDGKALESEG